MERRPPPRKSLDAWVALASETGANLYLDQDRGLAVAGTDRERRLSEALDVVNDRLDRILRGADVERGTLGRCDLTVRRSPTVPRQLDLTEIVRYDGPTLNLTSAVDAALAGMPIRDQRERNLPVSEIGKLLERVRGLYSTAGKSALLGAIEDMLRTGDVTDEAQRLADEIVLIRKELETRSDLSTDRDGDDPGP